MTNKLDDFARLEKQLPLSDVTSKGMQVWPYLRAVYFFDFAAGLRPVTVSIKLRLQVLTSAFYSFFGWFGSYSFWSISNRDQRKLINNYYVDKSMDYLPVPKGSMLCIEMPNPSHCPRRKVASATICSRAAILLLEGIIQLLFLRRITVERSQILEQLNMLLGIEVDYRGYVRKTLAQYYAMRFLLKVLPNPKAVFLLTSYSIMGYVRAFKEHGIKVVEIQHGVVNETHEAYNVPAAFDPLFYPDYFFAFGEREPELLARSFYIRKKVFAVGNGYIDRLRSQPPSNDLLKKLSSNYYRTTCVTIQEGSPTEDHLNRFIKDAALLNERLLYIIIPRTYPAEHFDSLEFPGNVKVIDSLSFQEIVVHCDFHSTVYSSCAVEATSLGVVNIFIDIDGQARYHFGTIFKGKTSVQFAGNPREYVTAIMEFPRLSRETVIAESEGAFVEGYGERAAAAIDSLMTEK